MHLIIPCIKNPTVRLKLDHLFREVPGAPNTSLTVAWGGLSGASWGSRSQLRASAREWHPIFVVAVFVGVPQTHSEHCQLQATPNKVAHSGK